MRKTGFIFSESFLWHDAGTGVLFYPPVYKDYLQPDGASESPESKRRFKNLLEVSGLYDELYQIKPRPATEAQLMYFHTEAHLKRVKEASDLGYGEVGPHVNVGSGTYEIAALAVGGALEAVDAVVEGRVNNAYALTRPPGHHAESDRANGYCIFNNAVIAAEYARKERGLKKIMVLDWDAHHGNGIEDAFYKDADVLFISIHQEGCFPSGRGLYTDIGEGDGKGTTVNIPLYAGTGDAGYVYAFEQIVKPLADKFEPELIIIAAGQDANIFDTLSRLMLSSDGYRQMTKIMRELAEKHCGGKLIMVHEGGYSTAYVPFCSHAIIEELSGISTDVKDTLILGFSGTPYKELLPHQKARIDEIKAFLGV